MKERIRETLLALRHRRWDRVSPADIEELEDLLTRVAAMEEALEFYADPATYFAWAFVGDSPCGDWDSDFEETELGQKPGKRARAALDANRDVHTEHCCATHGCKYMEDSTCTVVSGEKRQSFPCEFCSDDPALRWMEEHRAELVKYAGQRVAIDPAKGIVAHGPDYLTVSDRVRALGLSDQILIAAVPAEAAEARPACPACGGDGMKDEWTTCGACMGTGNAAPCDGSDPEKCIIQGHYHGLDRLLGKK